MTNPTNSLIRLIDRIQQVRGQDDVLVWCECEDAKTAIKAMGEDASRHGQGVAPMARSGLENQHNLGNPDALKTVHSRPSPANPDTLNDLSFEDFFKEVFRREPTTITGEDGNQVYCGDADTVHRVWWKLKNAARSEIPVVDYLQLEIAVCKALNPHIESNETLRRAVIQTIEYIKPFLQTQPVRESGYRCKVCGADDNDQQRCEALLKREMVARPASEWHEDIGQVLWWTSPVTEPAYCGTPLDDCFPSYMTHWTPLEVPTTLIEVQEGK